MPHSAKINTHFQYMSFPYSLSLSVSVVTLLLDHGAQLETKNKLNDTPARTSYNTKASVNLLNFIPPGMHACMQWEGNPLIINTNEP